MLVSGEGPAPAAAIRASLWVSWESRALVQAGWRGMPPAAGTLRCITYVTVAHGAQGNMSVAESMQLKFIPPLRERKIIQNLFFFFHENLSLVRKLFSLERFVWETSLLLQRLLQIHWQHGHGCI